jgi:hypothetical protein
MEFIFKLFHLLFENSKWVLNNSGGVDTTTIGDLLKRVYGKRLIQMQNKAAFLYKMLPKSIEKPLGTGFYPGVSVSGNQRGGGAINEGEALHTAGNETILQFLIKPKINVWTIQISGLARAVSVGQEATFASGLVRTLDDALENMLKDCNRQSFGDGTGKLATVKTAATSATIVCDDVIYVKKGMYLDRFNSAGSKQADDAVVSSVNRATQEITFSASATVAVDDYYTRAKAQDSAPTGGKELAGTSYIIDDGTVASTFQGQSRITYPILRGNVIDAGEVNLTNDLLQRAADEVSIVGDGKIDFLISRHGQRRKYLSLTTPDKRYLDGKLDRGYQYIYWNGMKWYVDVDCPKAEIIGLTQKYFEKYEVRGIHLADDDNSILKWDGSTDGYKAYYRLYANLGSLKPNAHFRLRRLNEPTGSN